MKINDQDMTPDTIGRQILIEEGILKKCKKHLRYYLTFKGGEDKIEEEIRLQVDLFAIRYKEVNKKFIRGVLVNVMLKVTNDSLSSCPKCDRENTQEKSE